MRDGSNAAVVDVAAAESIDEHALTCAYCGCTHRSPCVLRADSEPFRMEELPALERRRLPALARCGWQRIVERLDDAGGHVGYFAVCTNADCVREHLADASAP